MMCSINMWYSLLLWTLATLRVQTLQIPISGTLLVNSGSEISDQLFADLEELSRIVDISYCVGLTGTGIQKPFQCLSRCHEFHRFELVTTWNTGPLFGDSCGYIALSHLPSALRIIVAFRGTYSITNTIIDLATLPQEYVPYPGDDGDKKNVLWTEGERCPGCTVHAGFIASWRETRHYITPYLEELVEKYPKYQLTLVGHSLGGALAALASLEYHYRGWTPKVTTFGEPRIGNIALMQQFDRAFPTHKQPDTSSTYRRVTHAGDPVPLLPISEWGYRMHGGEIYISKSDIPPAIKDLQACVGDEDQECIAGRQALGTEITALTETQDLNFENFLDWWTSYSGTLPIPPRFKVWRLFFAHRDYFWRLGLCIPGGDPWNWYKKPQQVGRGNYDSGSLCRRRKILVTGEAIQVMASSNLHEDPFMAPSRDQ